MKKLSECLLINDDDLNCDCKDKTIDDINITTTNFTIDILNRFDIVLYDGKKGTKLIKSKYTKTGKIE